MWGDCVQKEIWRQARFGAHVKHEEENFACLKNEARPRARRAQVGSSPTPKARKRRSISTI